MARGRPREYNYVDEAKKLDEWSLLDDSITLYGFTDDKSYLAGDLQDMAKKSEEFSCSLKRAKERIARRREKMLCSGDLHVAAWGRSARLYDTMLRAEEEATKDADVERKLKVAAAQPVNPFMQKLMEIDGKTDELVGRTSD